MSLETRMREFVKRLNLPLEVAYLPDQNNSRRAEIKDGTILIYDPEPDQAWQSLFHEILEYRLRGLISPHREIINKLIEAIEQITYKEKERILDQVMRDFSVWKELGPAPTSRDKRGELDKE